MSFEVGYKGITDKGINFQIKKIVSRWHCIVKIWKDKLESYKLVSFDQINNRNILFEEDFFAFVGDRNGSKRFNKKTS